METELVLVGFGLVVFVLAVFGLVVFGSGDLAGGRETGAAEPDVFTGAATFTAAGGTTGGFFG